MSNQINKRLLGDFCSFKYGKTIRKCEVAEKGGHPVFSGYQVVGYLDSYMYHDPQLLVVCRGIGGTGDIKFSPPKCSITNLSIVISIKDKTFLGYLFWVLKNADTHSLRTGSAQPQITINDLERFPVLIHESNHEQKAIAHILGTLDDKIELNRKTNETLESMAKALFKSWFVDFDPVRAKAEGRPTGLPAEISDLLPDSFEDSELGEIPSGWSISNLDDFIHLDSGLPYKGLLKGTGEAHLLTMGCADRALRFKSDGVHSYPSSIPARHLVNPGDIVICSHDLTQAREQLGAPFVVPYNFSGRIAAAATNTFIVRQKSPSTTEYLYQIFRSNGFREQMIASAKGSVILHISKESVLYYSFASPGSDRLISAYQSATDGMTQKIQEIGKGIYTLATIRDALLPKLISGEIRIPDAEKMLEEVGV